MAVDVNVVEGLMDQSRVVMMSRPWVYGRQLIGSWRAMVTVSGEIYALKIVSI